MSSELLDALEDISAATRCSIHLPEYLIKHPKLLRHLQRLNRKRKTIANPRSIKSRASTSTRNRRVHITLAGEQR